MAGSQPGRVGRAVGLATNLWVRRDAPSSLIHFVTNRCNARCAFCFLDFDDPALTRGELTLAEIDATTRTVGPHLRNVNLTGGEPFTRPDLAEIAGLWLANSAARSLFFTSNGSFPDRMVDLARETTRRFPGAKLVFSLSIDGLPERHDAIRRVPGLFARCLEAYGGLRRLGGDVMVNVGITVSPESVDGLPALYDALLTTYGVRSLSATLARDEGVYTVPEGARPRLVEGYRWLTRKMAEDRRVGRLDGYDPWSLQGRIMNGKNEVLNEVLADQYEAPRYVSPCHAGALIGVIAADGGVHPCEILDRPYGNLRDVGFDFLALWRSEAAEATRRFIQESRCHCTWECGWTFNLLGNPRYLPRIVRAAAGA